MEFDLIAWFLCISFSISFLYFLRQANKSSSNSRLPPGPKPLPIIGSMLAVGDQPHRSLARLARAHGPLMTLQLGHVTTIIASSPDVAREILQKHDVVCATRSVPDAMLALSHYEKSVVWLPPAEDWRNLRRTCHTLFTSQKLDGSHNHELRRQKLLELKAYVSKSCAARQDVDVGRAAFTTALNLLSNTIFSIDLVDVNARSSHEFKDLVAGITKEGGSPNISDFFPWLAALDLQGNRRRMSPLFAKMYTIIDEQIDRRLSTMKEDPSRSEVRGDFLDSLLGNHGEEDGKLDRDTIKALLLDLFSAGSEATSATVEWAMAELLRNPEAMARAKAELARVIAADMEPEVADINQLPYLQAVVKETLRMHPSVPFLLPRSAEREVEIGGYVVPKGARILVNVWASGHDSKMWPDAEEFMPERFLEKDIDLRGQYFELIPFGAGRRICPGLPLAFRMVHLMLATLLHRFDWRLADDMKPGDLDMSEKFGITLTMAVPLRATPCSA